MKKLGLFERFCFFFKSWEVKAEVSPDEWKMFKTFKRSEFQKHETPLVKLFFWYSLGGASFGTRRKLIFDSPG